MKSHTVNAQPDPSELTVNSIAAMTITRTRPKRSAIPPANHAPTAEPISAHATAIPVVDDDSAKWPRIASTAPLMTAVSKPNRKPPIAATADTRMALPWPRSLTEGVHHDPWVAVMAARDEYAAPTPTTVAWNTTLVTTQLASPRP